MRLTVHLKVICSYNPTKSSILFCANLCPNSCANVFLMNRFFGRHSETDEFWFISLHFAHLPASCNDWTPGKSFMMKPEGSLGLIWWIRSQNKILGCEEQKPHDITALWVGENSSDRAFFLRYSRIGFWDTSKINQLTQLPSNHQ